MSNLLEKSSILITPTAYSDGKIHAEIPIQSLGVDADLNFTRGGGATRRNKDNNVVPSQGNNVPRINYENGVGSLLFEPQSTNEVTQSQVFSGYSGSGVVVADDAIISPDGTLNGASVTDNNDGGTGFSNQIVKTRTVDVLSNYTFSIFAKKKGNDYVVLRTSAFTTPDYVNSFFDLNLGTVLSVGAGHTAKIENYGNGWYRCSIAFTTDAVDTSGTLQMRLSKDGADTNVTRDGTNSIYTWGWQFEKQSFATSYIPTSGSIQTRLAERASRSGLSDLINDSEGVLYFEGSALSDDGTSRRISLSDNTGNNKIVIGFSDITDNVKVLLKGSGVTSFNNNITIGNLLSNSKFALKYKENDFALWVNGVEVFTDSLGGTPIGLSALKMSEATGGSKFVGRLKSLGVYKTALTDEELECLTKI